MPITTIFFIRHASVDYLQDPEKDLVVDLSPIGRTQAEGLAEKMTDSNVISVANIYSSDLPRAIATIKPYADKVGIPVERDNRLREHDYRGDPKVFHEAQKINPDFRHPGGEALHESGQRFIAAVGEIINKHFGQNIIISTHGTVFTEYMKNIFNKNDNFYFELSNPDIYKIQFEGLTAISYRRLTELLPDQVKYTHP